jgi:hypothetical protein
MTPGKPTPVQVKGIDIRTTVIDEQDDVVKHTITFYPEFDQWKKGYVDEKGRFRMEIVKRKTPSTSGHEYWPRLASSLTNPCVTDEIIPKAVKANDLM